MAVVGGWAYVDGADVAVDVPSTDFGGGQEKSTSGRRPLLVAFSS
jgi:hypothetical protein